MVLAALVAFCAACSSGPKPQTVPSTTAPRRSPVAESERAFLADPLAGYPLVADPDSAAEVRRLYRQLLSTGDVDALWEPLRQLLERDAGFHPGQVLAAQADLLEQRYPSAVQRLQVVVGELPGYTAALLALGRAGELGTAPLVAFEAYQAAAGVSPEAAQRLEELRPRTLEIVYNRMTDAILRGRLDMAESSLERLRAWGPTSRLSWQAARELAVARSDPQAELEAVRELLGWTPEDLSLLARRAELEVSVGDPGAGVKILRELTETYPSEVQFAESLERAEFRWRLRMMPAKVHELISLPELHRSEFAALLYWVIPGVRHGRVQSGRIAADILDHPQREAIARVVNLGLMNVDSALHRFSPEAPVHRVDALASLLRFLGDQRPRIACLGTASFGAAISYDSVCRTAATCRILDSAADCLPRTGLSGEEGLELVRRSLRLMGER